LFSLGAILHELLSGGRTFPGGSFVESGYAILHHDPPPLPPEVPPAAAQVVQRCLEKDPGRRFQSAADLAFALEVLRGGVPSGRAPASAPLSHRRSGQRLVWAAALGLAIVAGAGAFAWAHRPPPETVDAPSMEQVTFRWGGIRSARFAPDGRVFYSAAFEGRPEEVFTRPPGSAMSQPLGLLRTRLAAVSRSGELA